MPNITETRFTRLMRSFKNYARTYLDRFNYYTNTLIPAADNDVKFYLRIQRRIYGVAQQACINAVEEGDEIISLYPDGLPTMSAFGPVSGTKQGRFFAFDPDPANMPLSQTAWNLNKFESTETDVEDLDDGTGRLSSVLPNQKIIFQDLMLFDSYAEPNRATIRQQANTSADEDEAEAASAILEWLDKYRASLLTGLETLSDLELTFKTFERVDTCRGAILRNEAGAGSFTDLTEEANSFTTNDVRLLPPTQKMSDGFYYGTHEAFDSVDISISQVATGTWSLDWEYWDGTAWSDLSGVTDNTNGYSTLGENRVSWTVPTDWKRTSVDGKKRFWVRALISTFTSSGDQPRADWIRMAFTNRGRQRIRRKYLGGQFNISITEPRLRMIDRSAVAQSERSLLERPNRKAYKPTAEEF